jgi:hypothetical protein
MSLDKSMAGIIGRVTMLVLLCLMLEGCQKPIIETPGDVNGDISEKTTNTSPPQELLSGCSTVFVPENQTLINAMGNTVTCNAGSQRCLTEGRACRRAKKCTTVERTPGVGDCDCWCM